jgi:hypothetical protein
MIIASHRRLIVDRYSPTVARFALPPDCGSPSFADQVRNELTFTSASRKDDGGRSRRRSPSFVPHIGSPICLRVEKVGRSGRI